MPRLLALVTVVLVALGAPAARAAQHQVYDYDVVVDGFGDQDETTDTPTPCGDWRIDNALGWKWQTRTTASFVDGELFFTTQPTHTALVRGAIGQMSVPDCTTGARRTGVCRGTDWAPLTHPTGTRLTVLAQLPGQPATVRLDAWQGGTIRLDDCSGDFKLAGDQFAVASPTPIDVPLAASDVGAEEIKRVLDWSATGKQCPHYAEQTLMCSYRLKLEVTFLRTRSYTTDDRGNEVPPPGGEDTPAPPSPPAGPGGETPAPAPSPPAPPPSTPTVKAGRAHLSKDGRTATVRVRCSARCAVSAEAVARERARRRARARSAAATALLARTQLMLDPGRERSVRLKLSRASARAARRAGGVVLRLIVAPDGGAPVTVTRTALQLT